MGNLGGRRRRTPVRAGEHDVDLWAGRARSPGVAVVDADGGERRRVMRSKKGEHSTFNIQLPMPKEGSVGALSRSCSRQLRPSMFGVECWMLNVFSLTKAVN